MRLTNSTLNARLLADLQAGYTRIADTQRSISSGKRVERPSDDPLAASRGRLQRSELEGLDRYEAAGSSATAWLGAAEAGLAGVTDILQRARELAVQGANGTIGQGDRDRLAQELDHLAAGLKDALNHKLGDAYVFSGTATTTAPYDPSAGDTPRDDGGALVRDVGPGVAIQLNGPVPVTPSGTAAITAAAIGGNGADGRGLQTLRDTAAHLRAGNVTSVATTDLQAIDRNLGVVLGARSAVGATQNRVDAATDRVIEMADTAEAVRSDLEDTDVAKALTDLAIQQSAYQAALRTGAQIIQPSLLDFLR
jgi:flagellar hook-associated protein 3 FlgL